MKVQDTTDQINTTTDELREKLKGLLREVGATPMVILTDNEAELMRMLVGVIEIQVLQAKVASAQRAEAAEISRKLLGILEDHIREPRPRKRFLGLF